MIFKGINFYENTSGWKSPGTFIFYGTFRLMHLKSHESFLPAASFCIVSFAAFSQEAVRKIPTHVVEPPVYSHESFKTSAYIDSALFFKYIDWVLQKDSLPQQYKESKYYDINLRYIISKEGKLTQVKAVEANEEEKELVEFIRKKLLAFPHRWYPATQMEDL